MKRRITTLLSIALLAMGLVMVPASQVLAAPASQGKPADSAKKADCNKNQKAVQIGSGKNKGKWYCTAKSQAGNGGGGGGGGGGAGGGGGGAAAGGAGAAGSSTPAEQAACDGLNELGGTSCGGGQSAINNVASRVINLISLLAGIIAVIMIIVSGIRYVTSGGDSNKVSAAKTALIYALIGIAIAALAQVLVHFVLSQTAGV